MQIFGFEYTIIPNLRDFLNKNQTCAYPTRGRIFNAHPIPLNKTHIIKNDFIFMYANLFAPLSIKPSDLAAPLHFNAIIYDDFPNIANIIFIAPKANSSASLPDFVTISYAEIARECGYVPIINNENLTLKTAMFLACNCALAICARSGFVDCIAKNSKNLLIYYENKNLLNFYGLKKLGLKQDANEIVSSEIWGDLLDSCEYKLSQAFLARKYKKLYKIYAKNKNKLFEIPLDFKESCEFILGLILKDIFRFRFISSYKKFKKLHFAPKLSQILKKKIYESNHFIFHHNKSF